jgi:hypothetical protein
VARLYPQALGFRFVASYVSQGYGGGIRPLLHMEYIYIYALRIGLMIAAISSYRDFI